MILKKELRVGKSLIHGKGVFTQRSIKKGETICFLEGKKVSIPQLKKRYESGKERGNLTDPFQIAKNKYLLLKKPYLSINHSCLQNAGVRGKNTLFALRDIRKDEEITYDYSTTEWEDLEAWGTKCKLYKEFWKLQCHCGSRECRKIVREFPSLPEKVKREYRMQYALPNHILKRLQNKF